MYKNYSKQTAGQASEQEAKQPIFNKTIDGARVYTVPSDLIRYYAELEITENEYLFLNALMAAKDKENGRIRIKLKTLAEWLGVSEKWARQTGRDLEKRNYITRHRDHQRATYRYSLDGLHKRLAACVEKDGSKSRGKDKFFFMPAFFVQHFCSYRKEYGIGPREFVLLSLFLSYYKAPRQQEIGYATIEKYLGWITRTVKRAVARLEQRTETAGREFIHLERGENRKYRFDVEPFISALTRDVMAWNRDKKAGQSEGGSSLSMGTDSSGRWGQKVPVNGDKKFRSMGTDSSAPVLNYSFKTTGIYITGFHYYPASPEKYAPVIVDHSAEKADPENRPQPQEQAHQETAATVSADQENGQAYSTEQAYQEWEKKRSEQAKRDKEERVRKRVESLLDFFEKEMDPGMILRTLNTNPDTKAAYEYLLEKDLVPLDYRIPDVQQAAGEVMSAM